jgi:hypothetical protein
MSNCEQVNVNKLVITTVRDMTKMMWVSRGKMEQLLRGVIVDVLFHLASVMPCPMLTLTTHSSLIPPAQPSISVVFQIWVPMLLH